MPSKKKFYYLDLKNIDPESIFKSYSLFDTNISFPNVFNTDKIIEERTDIENIYQDTLYGRAAASNESDTVRRIGINSIRGDTSQASLTCGDTLGMNSIRGDTSQACLTCGDISLSDNLNNNLICQHTMIGNLNSNDKKEINRGNISFLSEMRQEVKCIPTVFNENLFNKIEENIDLENPSNSWSLYREDIPDCWWCRHPIPKNCIPIGCPINFNPSIVSKTFYSEISKDTFTIREKIPNSKIDSLDLKNNNTICIKNKNYYNVDGIFCSFNCCKAWILDNKHNSIYDNSDKLLVHMYNQIFDQKIKNITPADDWKLLKNKGGGILDIETFRNNFNKVTYEYHGHIKDLQKNINHLFEQKLKF